MKPYKFNKYQLAWLKKLRSGRFKQGKKYLKKDGRYCCLGVGAIACGVRGDNKYLNREQVLEDGMAHVAEKLKLFGGDGASRDGMKALVTFNDVDELTFEEIADILESNPREFFTD